MDNRFRHGTKRFELENSLRLSAETGMRFERAILDAAIGPETVLILTDTTPFAYELKRQQPFQLFLTSGMAQTSIGPVLFLLWWMPPLTDGKPFALYEHILNPTRPGITSALTEVAEQSHLHVILMGTANELLGVYEFENVFDVGSLVPMCEWACAEYAGMDFAAAKAEYEETNDPMALLQEALARSESSD